MSNNHAPPAPQQRTDDDTNNTNIDRVLAVSRVVWDNVVSPGWLDGPRDSRGNIKSGPDGCRQWDLFRAAEAMFPIVGPVCRRVLAFDPRWGAYIGSYCAIATAASIPAPSCVAWILNNRHVRGRIDNDIRELSFPMSVTYVGCGAPDAKVVLAASPKRAGSQGDSDSWRVDAVDFGVVVKEVSATLAGLLMGGHVGLATSLFGDVNHPESIGCGTSTTNNTGCTLPRLWDGHRIVSWENACHTENGSDHPVNGGVAGLREKVIEHMRESGNLHLGQSVCSSGSVDGVRWLVGVLGVETKEAPWLLYEPIRSCLYDGNMEVVRWLFERFELGKHQTALSDLCNSCACGPHPGNVKWFLSGFPLCSFERSRLIFYLLSNKHSTVEDCQWPWVQDFLRENGETDILQDVRNPEVVKWLLTMLPTLPHDNSVLNRVCVSTGDVGLAQWLVTEHNFTPTAATFASACSRGSTLARWLSTRVTLSQSDIIKSLVFALSWGNIEVAEWLNETFHVMDTVNSNTEVSENCLIQLCTESGDYRDSVVGLEWFLQHLSSPDHSGISMSCIHKAISQAFNCCVNSVALLLDTFPAVVRGIGQGDFKEIVIGFMKLHLRGFQHLCSDFDVLCPQECSTLLTPNFFGHCLTSESFHPYSSKVVKWVIQKFNLQYSQIKANHNRLLFGLLTKRKNRCAQWLLDTFDIPLSDIVDMAQLCSETDDSIDLTGWHMILDRYGTAIDGALVRKHLMPLVSRSPDVAIHTINSFGLTIDEFRDYVTSEFNNPFGGSFSGVVRLWLGMPLLY